MRNLEPYACVKQWFNIGDHAAVKFDGKNHTIQTLEGNVKVEPGDWIIGPGSQNEHWSISNDIFKKKYSLNF